MPLEHQSSFETILVADTFSTGDGNYKIVPKKFNGEITCVEAAKILNLSRSTLCLIITDSPLAKKLIKWRWLTDRQGKRIFQLSSIIAYRDALRDPEVKASVYGAADQRQIRTASAPDRRPARKTARKNFVRRKPA